MTGDPYRCPDGYPADAILQNTAKQSPSPLFQSSVLPEFQTHENPLMLPTGHIGALGECEQPSSNGGARTSVVSTGTGGAPQTQSYIDQDDPFAYFPFPEPEHTDISYPLPTPPSSPSCLRSRVARAKQFSMESRLDNDAFERKDNDDSEYGSDAFVQDVSSSLYHRNMSLEPTHRTLRRARTQFMFSDLGTADRSPRQISLGPPNLGHSDMTIPSIEYLDPEDEFSTTDFAGVVEVSDFNSLSQVDMSAVYGDLHRRNTHLSPEDALRAGEVDEGMVMHGVDVQGIPWHTLPFSREEYRDNRLKNQAARDSGELAASSRSAVKKPQTGASYFGFSRNTRQVKCSIVHFQLRNLVWATSCHDVFMVHEASILHWDTASRTKTNVLDLSGSSGHRGSGEPLSSPAAGTASLGNIQISTMIAKDDFVIAGGFYGEMIAKNIRTHTIAHNKRITFDENAITNAIDIFENNVITSNNDCFVRIFDLPTFTKVNEFRFAKAVNHATQQHQGKLLAVAGDDHPVYVVDSCSGDYVATVKGHQHFNFATGWHPSGQLFATGSQDLTCRVWDVRNLSQPLCILGAHVGAIRSLRFSSCGRFLAMAEHRDYVHIIDMKGGFEWAQEIDLFGEVAGISLSPDSNVLFIGMVDRNYGSLMEYERNRHSAVLHKGII